MSATDRQVKPSLANHPLFAGIADSQFKRLDRLCTWQDFNDGTTIIEHLDDSCDVYFILHGRARVLIHTPTGQEVFIRELRDGDMFGELAALDHRPRSASVVATSRGCGARMAQEHFRKAIHDHNLVCDRVLALLTSEIRRLAQRLNERETLPVLSRLILELLRLARPDPQKRDQAVISPPPRHQDLASRIGTHRERITKDLKLLEQAGFLSRNKQRFALLDVERLRQRAQSPICD